MKARQEGISTDSAGILFHRVHLRNDRTAYIVGHKLKSSEHLYDMVKGYLDNLPDAFKWGRQYENKKQLKFKDNGSQFKVETAEDVDLGKSDTIQYVLMSERAYWRKNCEPSLLSSVPKIADSIVIKESTANLFGDDFHRDWLRAVRGESDYTPVFIAWFEHKEYRMAVPDNFRVTADEDDMMKRYGLDMMQMAWYRNTLNNECKGDLNEMHKYYPGNSTECFLTSGQQTFGTANKNLQDMYLWSGVTGYKQGVLEVVGGAVKFIEQERGWLKVWDKPDLKYQYRMGVDTAEGKEQEMNSTEGSDYSAADIMSIRMDEQWKQVATIHERVDPDLFAYHCFLVAVWYNRAIIMPEANSCGRETIKALLRLKYHRIHNSKQKLISGKRYGVSDYGWLQTEKSRKELITFQKQALRENYCKLQDGISIQEHLTMITNKSGKDEAGPGCHDDHVISGSLASMCCYLYGYFPDKKAKRSSQYLNRG